MSRPILRWVGGKARVARRIHPVIAPLEAGQRYFEPFAGAASLFFCLRPQAAVLGDENKALVDMYRNVATAPEKVWRALREIMGDSRRSAYLRARVRFNEQRNGSQFMRAALFIYLNRTCFNGVWRVNRDGAFNVPWGALGSPKFPTLPDLLACSSALRGAAILHGDFEATLRSARSGDFVYLDPPYPPVDATAYFTHYTRERFGHDRQVRVSVQFRKLDEMGCRVLMSNADQPQIRRLYAGFEMRSLETSRFVAAHGHRYRIRDLLVANFPLSGLGGAAAR